MERPFRSASALILLLVSSGACATTLNSYWKNRQGIKKLEDKSYFNAYQSFTKALENDPLNPELHLNLALTFETNEELEKAEQGYKSALKLLPENSQRRFEALYNLGEVLGKEKKIDEALKYYQAALEMAPDSKEIKTNIELLWQGGGQGQGQDQNQNQDQKGQNKQQNAGNDGQDQKQKKPQDGDEQKDQKEQKKQPKPFSSQELTAQDVKKILDEIKNQEQAIRAQEYEREVKDAPRGKDW